MVGWDGRVALGIQKGMETIKVLTSSRVMSTLLANSVLYIFCVSVQEDLGQ